MNVTIGATLTGGTSTALTLSGIGLGKSSYVTPDHAVLEPETVEFYSTPPKTTNSDPGTARAGAKISLAKRSAEEGCCTVTAGAVIVDLGVRWNLSQPETLVDEAIAWLRGLVYTTEFENLVKKAVVPSN